MARKANPRKPVIAFDAQGMLGNKTGIGQFGSMLIENMARSMPEVHFVGYYYDFLGRAKARLPVEPNISYIRHRLLPIQVVNLLRRYLLEIPLELRIFKRADVVLYLNYLSAPSITRTPTLSFIYDLSFLDHPEFMSKKNQSDLSRFVPVTIKRSAYIVTISKFTRARLQLTFPELEGRITVVPIPPNPTAIEKQDRFLNDRLQQLGIQKQAYILYVGTLEPRKNIANLVRAYSSLPKNIRSAYSLVLAGGKGWQDNEIVDVIQSRQAAGLNIIQTGYVSDEEKAALYQNASCFVLPSHYEGFGMPIFEALQYDTPVAVSDIPVFREVAGNAASYFDKDNPSDIAQKLSEILQDPLLRTRLQNAGQQKLATFSWAQNVVELRKVLDSVRSGNDAIV